MQRLTIVVAGACNSGKSSLVNLITGQTTSIVSDIAGTTTDTVRRMIELPNVGPAVIIDTPGLDDKTELGADRIRCAARAMDEADIVVMTVGENPAVEREWLDRLRQRGIRVIEVANKADTGRRVSGDVLSVSARTGGEIDRNRIIEAVIGMMTEEGGSDDLLRNLVCGGDVVVLVMPQDSSAPAGRLILPQVQTIRALLDKCAVTVCVTPDNLTSALDKLRSSPALIITDSQAFAQVEPLVPEGTKLTSFSVLMAALKGDIEYFAESVRVLDTLSAGDRILIAEACTHVPKNEDIGRVKLPAMLRRHLGDSVIIDHAGGRDFPDDLTPYSLIIHCGACMFNRNLVMSRLRRARTAGVPMTNYGIAIAHLTGILPKVCW